MSTYKITLRGIRFRTKLGVSQSERDMPQDVTVNVELTLPTSCLPEHDELKDVFDYDRVVRLVVEAATAHQHRLLETYAKLVLDVLLTETPATEVRVEVEKERVPTTHSVDAVRIELSARRA